MDERRQLNQEIVMKTHRLVFLMDKITEKTLKQSCELTFSQFLILTALNHCTKVPQSEVARFLDQTQAAVSRQVDILKDRGMVSRMENPENRREHILELTDLGKSKVVEAEAAIDAKFDELFRELSESEKTEFVDLVEKIVKPIYSECKQSGCVKH